jgi:class 3 adenylate cyclase
MHFLPPQPCTERIIEIAHVLFMDIVGLGRLPIELQTAVVEELQHIVRTSHEFRKAEATGDLLRRFTGDGMVLVFQADVLSPIRLSIEVARELKRRPHILLRMGINSGPVHCIQDINNQVNVSGEGVIQAQRVMDCGDGDHILVSASLAETVVCVSAWSRYFRYLGECPIKHGKRIALYSLVTEEVGVATCPRKMLDDAARSVEQRRARTRRPGATNELSSLLPIALATGIVLALLCYCFAGYRQTGYNPFATVFGPQLLKPPAPVPVEAQRPSPAPASAAAVQEQVRRKANHQHGLEPDRRRNPGDEDQAQSAGADAQTASDVPRRFATPSVDVDPDTADGESSPASDADPALRRHVLMVHIVPDGLGPRDVVVRLSGEGIVPLEQHAPDQMEGSTIHLPFTYRGDHPEFTIRYDGAGLSQEVWPAADDETDSE